MAEFQLVLALGRAFAKDTPERKAVWRSIKQAITNGQLLTPKILARTPEQVRRRLYRDLVRETLPEGWIKAAEQALVRSPVDWLNYMSGLSAPETSPLNRLDKLLRLKNSSAKLWTPPFTNLFFDCLADVRLDSTMTATLKNPAVTKAETPTATNAPLLNEQTFFTLSQQAALQRLTTMATLYFSSKSSGGLRPRFAPLLIGPTGSGKTAVVERVANKLKAHLMRVTVSEWTPNGAREETSPTLRTLVATLLEHDRVVLFIDELDKLSDSSGTWNRSCLCEIFNVLERDLPTHFTKNKTDQERLSVKTRDRLWIVGAGTWSHLQPSHANTRPMGFSSPAPRVPQSTIPTTDIVERALKDGFPVELLGRFHNVPFFLNYPDEHETAEILEHLGLVKLAKDTGRFNQIQDFTWRPFGLRNLESLFADLLVARAGQCIPCEADHLSSKAPDPSSPHPALAVD